MRRFRQILGASIAMTLLVTGGMAQADETFENPVLKNDFPDPFVLRFDGTFYAYATNAGSRNVQVSRSADLVSWDIPSEALPGLGPWVRLGNSHVWAPEVIRIGDRFVLYYTARHRDMDRQCIGVAMSERPDARFRDTSEKPFICQVEEGGSIDASPFRDDDGTLYLTWKNDGNHVGAASYIYVQELAPDGKTLVGEPARLIRNDRPWEGPLVEAPTMWKRDGTYYLFYSANSFAGIEYAVGYAVCEKPMGPCEKAPENPVLSSRTVAPFVIGPGHQSLVVDDAGQTWIVYHAWEVLEGGTRGHRRLMWIDRVDWVEGRPVVHGPTVDAQPVPTIGRTE